MKAFHAIPYESVNKALRALLEAVPPKSTAA
jgi:hypothetical protein